MGRRKKTWVHPKKAFWQWYIDLSILDKIAFKMGMSIHPDEDMRMSLCDLPNRYFLYYEMKLRKQILQQGHSIK